MQNYRMLHKITDSHKRMSRKSGTISSTVCVLFVTVVSDGTEQRQRCGSNFAMWRMKAVRSCRSLWAYYVSYVTAVFKLQYCKWFQTYDTSCTVTVKYDTSSSSSVAYNPCKDLGRLTPEVSYSY
jgi:hypothetical protein